LRATSNLARRAAPDGPESGSHLPPTRSFYFPENRKTLGDRNDLSIFTRGQLGNLCGLDKGRTLYLDAYRKCAGREVSERSVLFYEILLVMRQVCEVLGSREARYTDEYLRRLARLVGRLRTS